QPAPLLDARVAGLDARAVERDQIALAVFAHFAAVRHPAIGRLHEARDQDVAAAEGELIGAVVARNTGLQPDGNAGHGDVEAQAEGAVARAAAVAERKLRRDRAHRRDRDGD